MDMFDIYLILKLDNIRDFFVGMAFIFGLLVLISTAAVSAEERWDTHWKVVPPIMVILFITSMLLTTLIPSTKQMAAILVLPPIINNEKVQELPNELLDLLGMSITKAKKLLQEETK